jgi:hypothetical protein
MMMIVKHSMEWELADETEVLGDNVPQWRFVHHKSHTTWPGLQHGTPATNRPSFGMASVYSLEESISVNSYNIDIKYE